MESYRNLTARQKAKALAVQIYRCTDDFPRSEIYGLTSQIRRAAISVPSNIAEGKGKHSVKELLQFLYQSRGSLLELKTQIEIAYELGYLKHETFHELDAKIDEAGRILNALINSFQSKARGVFLTPNT